MRFGGQPPGAQRRIPWRVGGGKKLCGTVCLAGGLPNSLLPVLSPGGEGHWRKEGAGQCPEAASGDQSCHECPEPWEHLAGFHEVLVGGGGGGGGHTSEGNQGPAKPEVPQDPDPGAHLSPSWQRSPEPASSPASDSFLGPCHGPILGQAAGPWTNPCSCGSPGPSLCTRHSPASAGPRPGLEKDRTLAPEW